MIPSVRYAIVIFLCLQIGVMQAQKRYADSLEKILLQSSPTYTLADSSRVQVLNNLAFALRNIEVARAASYARQARELAEKIGYARGLARAIGYQGMMAYRQGKYDFAIAYHLQSLDIADSINDRQLIAFRYNDLANVYLDKGDWAKAMLYNQKSLAIKQKLNDKEGIATSFRNMGMIYLRQKNYDSALIYLNQAEALAKEINDKRILGYVYLYLGELYTRKGEIPIGIRTLQEATRLHREINNQYGLAEALNSLAEAYLATNIPASAQVVFEDALAIAKRTGIRLEVQRAYIGLANTYEKQRQFAEALHYYKQYTSLKDSIFAEKNEETIAFLDAQFQNELKQTQIALLTKEKELADKAVQEEKRYNYALLAIIVIILIFAVLMTRSMLEKRRLSRDLLQKSAEIERQSQKLAELNDFKNRLFLMIAHDLRSPMAALKTTIDVLNPDILKGEELEMIRQELQRQFNATDETLQELLAWTQSQMEGEVLRPVGINLQDAVRQITEFLGNVAQAKNISVRNEVPPDIKVRADANHLSAIIRNLIANAIKFTLSGGVVTIQAAAKNQMAEIIVRDTGVGISAERLIRLFNGERLSSRGTAGEKGTGLGLAMVKNMVEKNGGSIRAESIEGKGSMFCFSLPLDN